MALGFVGCVDTSPDEEPVIVVSEPQQETPLPEPLVVSKALDPYHLHLQEQLLSLKKEREEQDKRLKELESLAKEPESPMMDIETILFTSAPIALVGWTDKSIPCTLIFLNGQPTKDEIDSIRIERPKGGITVTFNAGEEVLSSQLSVDRQKVEFLFDQKSLSIASTPIFEEGAFSRDQKRGREITVEITKKGLFNKEHYQCQTKISSELLYGEKL